MGRESSCAHGRRLRGFPVILSSLIALCPPHGPYCRLVERALFFPRPETRLAYSLPVKRLKPDAILDRRQNGPGIKQEVLCDKMSRGVISASRTGRERRPASRRAGFSVSRGDWIRSVQRPGERTGAGIVARHRLGGRRGGCFQGCARLASFDPGRHPPTIGGRGFQAIVRKARA